MRAESSSISTTTPSGEADRALFGNYVPRKLRHEKTLQADCANLADLTEPSPSIPRRGSNHAGRLASSRSARGVTVIRAGNLARRIRFSALRYSSQIVGQSLVGSGSQQSEKRVQQSFHEDRIRKSLRM
jgi:hypothetical protein